MEGKGHWSKKAGAISGSSLAEKKSSADGGSKAATPAKDPDHVVGNSFVAVKFIDMAQHGPKITSTRMAPPARELLAFKPQYANLREVCEAFCKRERSLVIAGPPGQGKTELVKAMYKNDDDNVLFIRGKNDLKKYDEAKHDVIVWEDFKVDEMTLHQTKLFLSRGVGWSSVDVPHSHVDIAPGCFRILIVNQTVEEMIVDLCRARIAKRTIFTKRQNFYDNCFTNYNEVEKLTWLGMQVIGLIHRVLFVPILEPVYQTAVGESAKRCVVSVDLNHTPTVIVKKLITAEAKRQKEVEAEKSRQKWERMAELTRREQRKERQKKKEEKEKREKKLPEKVDKGIQVGGTDDESVDARIRLKRALAGEPDKRIGGKKKDTGEGKCVPELE